MVILAAVAACGSVLQRCGRADEPMPQTAPLIQQDFEDWIWVPISHAMREEGKRLLARGEPLSYEYRGPLFRVPRGFGNLPAGRMLEGREAFQGGRSMALQAGRDAALVVGLHGPYADLLQTGKRYAYRVSIRGQGAFCFRAWVNGVDPATGQSKWLDFPNLVTIPVTDAWKTHAGQFQVPAYDRPPYRVADRLSAAIVVEQGQRICVDNFEIRENPNP